MQLKSAFIISILMQMALATPLNHPAGRVPPTIQTDVGDMSKSPPPSNPKACKQPPRGTPRGSKNLLRRTFARQFLNRVDLGNLAAIGMGTTLCVEGYVGGQVLMDERRHRLEAEERERELEVAMGKRPPSPPAPPKQPPVPLNKLSGSNSPAWINSA
ncbi:hypothetical protein MCOR02_001105 [Pyricularia oryzae]|nr:hypothetical protein MCOR02_001105 [Pyricularia oryzae]KAI6271095.1 hypothetical protein MCOR26_007936 [Pyricularia oryzae]KAI6318091.1 hypothetical protein MCOR34_003742 [Pyricularia oryzae]KAI6329802.1 hypothetical protein MCOR29_002139 [Pyricularia oryzae]KAI6380388.1 hypothetical protein MCOR32_004052 [Pyricularia oryzae]